MTPDLMFVVNSNVYNKMLGFDSVKTVDKFWSNATILKWVLAKAYGIDILVARDFPALTATNGKISSTSWDNTLGSIGLFYKPAVQYGFGQTLEIDVYKIPGKGARITATFEFGAKTAYEVAWLGKTVSTGTWVTL